jgi:hypothetical protein
VTPQQFAARRQQILDEEEKQPLAWWWLSFADPDRPEGQQFLGACVVMSHGLLSATLTAHTFGCNPGGQIQAMGPLEITVRPGWANRLLTREECAEFEKAHLPS